MNRIVIPRSPGVSFPLLIVAVVAQFALSLPAATSSGFPPVDLFREWVAPYLGFLAVLLFPLFDDDPTTRWTMRVMYSLGTILSLAWVLSNLLSPVPHQSNVADVLKYSLILAVPVYSLVWILEQGSSWIWDRRREFVQLTPAELRQLSRPFSIAASVSAALLVIVAVSLTQYYLTRPATRSDVGYTSQYHMKRILKALHDYGTFPHEPRGAEYALFNLRKLVDASVFDGSPRKKSLDRANWDVPGKRLLNSDFEYLNERSFAPPRNSRRIVVMAKPFEVPGWVIFGLANGETVWHKLTKSPGSAVLGNWLTEDGFLIEYQVDQANHEQVDQPVLEDWNKTHCFSRSAVGQGQKGVDKEYDGYKLVRMSDGTTTIEYQYSGNRLSGCRITTQNGTIVETIAIDESGRIIGIVRSPDDWESLSSSSKSPSS